MEKLGFKEIHEKAAAQEWGMGQVGKEPQHWRKDRNPCEGHSLKTQIPYDL